MKSGFTHNFKLIAWLTFIVYFIAAFCGHINFFIANLQNKSYFPLRSYLLTFDNEAIKLVSSAQKGIYNLAGFKALINISFPYKLIDEIFFIFISTALVVLFFLGYKIIQSNKTPQIEIVKWSIIFSFLMALAIPSHSSDLYGYIARGAQQSLYHHNPYLQTVSEIKGYCNEPLFLNFMWPHQVTTYGPIFIYITKIIVFLSSNNFFLSFINFKLLNLTLFFLIVLFLLRTKETKNIYLISWNPLILIQGLWNCHNDLFSGALIFFGLYLLKDKKYFCSVFCLTTAVGVKFISIMVIPFVIFSLLKNKSKMDVFLNIVLGISCGIILIFIFSIDYLTLDYNKIIASVNDVHKSLIALIFTLIKYFCHWQKVDCDLFVIMGILKYSFYFMFALFYIFILFRKKSDLYGDVALVLFIFLCFTLAKFHSWYLLNVIFLIPFLQSGIVRKILIAISMSHVYALTFFDQAKILNFTLMTLMPTLAILFKGKKK